MLGRYTTGPVVAMAEHSRGAHRCRSGAEWPIDPSGSGPPVEALLTPCLPLPGTSNPARGKAQVSYTLRKAGNVTVNLYDASGRLTARVQTGGFKQGRNTAPFDATRLARGVYFVKVEGASNFKTTKEGLGNDNTPSTHMWRTMIRPANPL